MLRRRKRKNKNKGRDSSIESRDSSIATMKGAPHAYDEASISNIDIAVGSSIQNNNIKTSLAAPLIPTDALDDELQRDIEKLDNTLGSDGTDILNASNLSSASNITPKEEQQKKTEKPQAAGSVLSSGTATSRMKISDIKEFDLVFWLLVWNCAIMYAIVLSWMNIGSDFLQTTYGYTHGKANAILTIPYSIAGVLQPIWGWISDKIGWRSQFLLLSSFIFVVAHYILGWIRIDSNPEYIPIAALTALGFGYSIFTAVIWPCFPLVVPPRAIGTAYGIPTSGYNLVLTIYYVLVGIFTSSVDNGDKYINVQYFLLITSISTVFTSLLLMYKDKRTGWRLYPSAFANDPVDE